MSESPNHKEILKREIKNHFATARHEDGVKRLIDFTQVYCADMDLELDAIMVSSDFYELLKKIRQGIIEEEKARIEKRLIIQRALLTLNAAWEASAQQTA